MNARFPVTPARVIMYDSTEAGSLPAGTVKAAGYVNGDFPSYHAILKRFPHARVLGIDVLGTGQAGASILDYEPGTPAYKNRDLVRGFISKRNWIAPRSACIYTDRADLDEAEEYAAGLWHVLWVANWGLNGTAGASLTGERTKSGNLIVATQLQNNKAAGFDMSDSLESWQ